VKMAYVLEIAQAEHVKNIKPVLENIAGAPPDVSIITEDGGTVETHKLLLVLFSKYLGSILGSQPDQGGSTGLSVPGKGSAVRNLLSILVEGSIFGANKEELLAAAKCGKVLGIDLKNLQIGGKKKTGDIKTETNKPSTTKPESKKPTNRKAELRNSTDLKPGLMKSTEPKKSSDIKTEVSEVELGMKEGDGKILNKSAVKTPRRTSTDSPCTNMPTVNNMEGLTSLSIKLLRPEASKHGITLNSGRKKKEQVVTELWEHYLQFHHLDQVGLGEGNVKEETATVEETGGDDMEENESATEDGADTDDMETEEEMLDSSVPNEDIVGDGGGDLSDFVFNPDGDDHETEKNAEERATEEEKLAREMLEEEMMAEADVPLE